MIDDSLADRCGRHLIRAGLAGRRQFRNLLRSGCRIAFGDSGQCVGGFGELKTVLRLRPGRCFGGFCRGTDAKGRSGGSVVVDPERHNFVLYNYISACGRRFIPRNGWTYLPALAAWL